MKEKGNSVSKLFVGTTEGVEVAFSANGRTTVQVVTPRGTFDHDFSEGNVVDEIKRLAREAELSTFRLFVNGMEVDTPGDCPPVSEIEKIELIQERLPK